jgi:hypothetical protein
MCLQCLHDNIVYFSVLTHNNLKQKKKTLQTLAFISVQFGIFLNRKLGAAANFFARNRTKQNI